MALEKEGYASAINGTTIVEVPIDADGNLMNTESSAQATGTKKMNFTRTNAANGRNENLQLVSIFFGFTDTDFNTASGDTFRVIWEG